MSSGVLEHAESLISILTEFIGLHRVVNAVIMLESGIILLSLYLSLNFAIHVNICIRFWHADGNWIRPFHRVGLELADVWHRCISFVG